jgi:hypothetical protein
MMTKTAAVLTLLVALAAAVYLIYLSTVARHRYEVASANCKTCTAIKDAVETNWRSVQSSIELLKAKKQYKEAERVAKEHAGERPVNFDVPCLDCEIAAPDYTAPTTVAALALLTSTILFGAVKPKRRR